MTDRLWWALVPVLIGITWWLLAVIRTLIAWRKSERADLKAHEEAQCALGTGKPETRIYSSYSDWQKDILSPRPLGEIFGRVPEGFFDRPEVKKERERLWAERVARNSPVLAARQRLAEIHKRLSSQNGAKGASGAVGVSGHPGLGLVTHGLPAAVPEKPSVFLCVGCGGSKLGPKDWPKDWPWCPSCYAKLQQMFWRL